MKTDWLLSSTEVIDRIAEDPTLLLDVDKHDKLVVNLRDSLKRIFDGAIACEADGIKPLAEDLPELYVEGLDPESIWQEMQLREKALSRWTRGTLHSLLGAHGERVDQFQIFKESPQGMPRSDEEEEEEMSSEEDEEEVSDDEEEEEMSGEEDEEEVSDDELEEEEVSGDEEEEEASGEEDEEEAEPVPIASDGFFDWNDMESFANELDKEHEEGRDGQFAVGNDSEGDLDEADRFDDEDFEDMEENDIAAQMRYDDFFDAPTGPLEPSATSSKKAKKTTKKKKKGSGPPADKEVRFMEPDEEEEMEGRDGGSDEEEEDEEETGEGMEAGSSIAKKKLTKHEKRQEKLQARLRDLEAANLEPRQWDLNGEVAGQGRPENSLLALDAEWERVRRPPPTAAIERTESLEEMIKKRISEEAWDDVTPKLPPKPLTSDEVVVPEVSQEKSKIGLGEEYAQHYLSQAKGVKRDDGNDEKREAARALFAKVCRKLDALSNFTFAPHPKVPDAKITPAVAAISMEEATPIGVSANDAQAPEEVYGKKHGRDGLVRAEGEMDHADRRRARQASKAKRRKARREKDAAEAIAARINPGLGNPYEKRKLTEHLRSNTNVKTGDQVQMDDKGSSHTKSTQFFAKLQDESQSNGGGKLKRRKLKEDQEPVGSGATFKL
eukprot:CAMPEP_0185747964 /NCGR_PEP_ID=MMETSP1174-20130828/6613_1 /TAXON_ID=35687 /ORGANISM="Dictyocha speculum, Strain CCMP1381" /LENGTH=665 /DNA_ID=CAMNT_0028423405 /DNA_START=40 /DNA_END=2037 /DNA_ORIENTATION=+